jgi:hypothetical protein
VTQRRAPDGPRSEEINWAPKRVLNGMKERKVVAGVVAGRHFPELNQQIDIAGGCVYAAGRRAKELESPDSVLLAGERKFLFDFVEKHNPKVIVNRVLCQRVEILRNLKSFMVNSQGGRQRSCLLKWQVLVEVSSRCADVAGC